MSRAAQKDRLLSPQEAALDPAECLTALLSKVREREIVTCDLESKDGPSQGKGFTRVFLAGVYDGAHFHAFRNHAALAKTKAWETRAIEDGGCIDQLMRYLLQRKFRGHYIYAHAGGTFDYLHFLPWLARHIREFSFTIIPVASSIQVLKVTERSSKQIFTFLDSLKLIPMGLDKAAKTFGYPGKLAHDLDMHEDDPRWETYLQGDCEALYQVVSKFQDTVVHKFGGELGITAPSTAMKLYRRRYMGAGQTPAMIPHHRHFKGCEASSCQGCLHAWIRGGYYGGRTEGFVTRAVGASYYDINSSYPAAMLEPMPGGSMKQYGPSKGPTDFARLERDAIGFVECTVHIPSTCFLPPLPYRHRKTGKLVFPSGTFSGVWSWEELKLLFDPLVGGSITQIVRSVWYQKKTLFFDFVKDLYAYRDKDSRTYDAGMAEIAKLMMNSLYGKFGMNEDRREIVVLQKGEPAPEGATFPSFEDGEDDILSRVCFLEKRVAAPYIVPQISAHITSLARIRLWRFMADCLRAGGRVYYCDTDSLVCSLDDLPTSTALGALKNEYPGEVLDVQLLGPKMYLLRKKAAFAKEHTQGCKDALCPGCAFEKFAMKGIPKDLRVVDTFTRLQNGETIHYERLEKIGAMQTHAFWNPPRMKRVKKRHIAQNDKRVFAEDGQSSEALYLDEA